MGTGFGPLGGNYEKYPYMKDISTLDYIIVIGAMLAIAFLIELIKKLREKHHNKK